MSPVIWREGPFDFGFSSRDRSHHPHDPHIHVTRDRANAKFTLNPVTFVYNKGFKRSDLGHAEGIIRENEAYMLEEWNAFFDEG